MTNAVSKKSALPLPPVLALMGCNEIRDFFELSEKEKVEQLKKAKMGIKPFTPARPVKGIEGEGDRESVSKKMIKLDGDPKKPLFDEKAKMIDRHPNAESAEFMTRSKHALERTPGAQLLPEIAATIHASPSKIYTLFKGDHPQLYAHTPAYSEAYGEFIGHLRFLVSHHPDKTPIEPEEMPTGPNGELEMVPRYRPLIIVVYGVTYAKAVTFTAFDLLLQEIGDFKNGRIIIARDACLSDEGTEEWVRRADILNSTYGIEVMMTDQIIEELSQYR
jgi:nicotinamidase-related amidase